MNYNVTRDGKTGDFIIDRKKKKEIQKTLISNHMPPHPLFFKNTQAMIQKTNVREHFTLMAGKPLGDKALYSLF